MYTKVGRGRYFFSVKELLALTLIPLATSVLVLILVNLKPVYKIGSTIISNQSPLPSIQKSSLKGLDRSIKRLVMADFRQKRENSVIELQTKLVLLESRKLMEGFILDNNLKPKFYPGRWDSANQVWREERVASGFRYFILRAFGNTYSSSPKEPPTSKAIKLLSSKLKVSHDKKTGFIQISLKWKDATEGAELINHFVGYANKFIAQRERNDIQKQIVKIEALLAKQENDLMRNVLLVELERLQQSLLLTNPEFKSAFKVLDPAMAPEKPMFKVPYILIALSILLTFVITIACITWLRPKNVRLKEST